MWVVLTLALAVKRESTPINVIEDGPNAYPVVKIRVGALPGEEKECVLDSKLDRGKVTVFSLTVGQLHAYRCALMFNDVFDTDNSSRQSQLKV